MNVRSLICVLTSALLLLTQLHLGGASGCSMCGASCRCASRASGDPCSVRSVGCVGGEGSAALGSVTPLQAVLVDCPQFAPQSELDRAGTVAFRLPPHPVLPRHDRPPRVFC